MTAIDSASLNWYESLADWGTKLVIAGVACEALEIILKFIEYKGNSQCFNKWCEEHKFWLDVVFPGIFWIMVVGGLVMEFRGSHQAQLIVQKENNRITQELVEVSSSLYPLSLRDVNGSVDRLRKFAGTRIEIAHPRESSHGNIHAAIELINLLDSSKWVITQTSGSPGFSEFRIWIRANSDPARLEAIKAAGFALANEIHNNGAAVIVVTNVAFTNCDIQLRIPSENKPEDIEYARRLWETNALHTVF